MDSDRSSHIATQASTTIRLEYAKLCFTFCFWLASCSLVAIGLAEDSKRTIAVAEPLDGAFALATADLNGDSRDDLLIGGENGLVRVFGANAGRIAPGQTVLSGYRVRSLAVADFDSDGAVDVAALCPDSALVILLKGRGNGEFDLTVRLAAPGSGAYGMNAADLNQDGLTDLAVAHFGGLSLFFGRGDGTFADPRLVRGSGGAISIAVGDLNRDGLPDLAVSRSSNSTISVYYASGLGQFQSDIAVSPRCDGYARVVKVADVDRDGIPDLAAACDSGIGLWLGSASGAWQYRLAIREQSLPLAMDVADFNGDSIEDILIGDYYNGRISIHLGKGDGTFVQSAAVASAGDVFAVAAADVDGDSKLDVTATSYSSSTAVVALGRGDGKFDGSIQLGAASMSFFRASPTGSDGRRQLALVMPARKTAFVLRSGSVLSIQGFRGYPVDATWGDFDRDGAPDLLVFTMESFFGDLGDDLGASLLLIRGRAGGGLSDTADRIATVPYPLSATATLPLLVGGEFSGDGIADFAYFNGATGTLQIFAGLGNGSFTPGLPLPGISAVALAAADFDGDGTGDVASSAGKTVRIHYGARDGMFRNSRAFEICTTGTSTAIFAGDFVGDSHPDILASCGDHLAVAPGSAGGLASSELAYSFLAIYLRTAPAQAVADFDRDGKLDLAMAWPINTVWGGGQILLTRGIRSYAVGERLSLAARPVAIAACDWDADGRLDLAVLSASEMAVSIRLASERSSQ